MLCSAGLRILVMITLLTMGCRNWRPGWFAHRRDAPSEPEIQSTQFVDEPAAAPGPAVVGSRLGLRPGETAAERALHLTEKLAQVQQERANAESNWAGEFQALRRERDESLQLIEEATVALERAKGDIEELRKELSESKERADDLSTQLEDARGQNEQFLQDLLKRLRNRNPQNQAGAVDPDVPTPQ